MFIAALGVKLVENEHCLVFFENRTHSVCRLFVDVAVFTFQVNYAAIHNMSESTTLAELGGHTTQRIGKTTDRSSTVEEW